MKITETTIYEVSFEEVKAFLEEHDMVFDCNDEEDMGDCYMNTMDDLNLALIDAAPGRVSMTEGGRNYEWIEKESEKN
jgi:hypothetical protein